MGLLRAATASVTTHRVLLVRYLYWNWFYILTSITCLSLCMVLNKYGLLNFLELFSTVVLVL